MYFDEQKEIEVISSAFFSEDRLDILLKYSDKIFYYDNHILILNAIKELNEQKAADEIIDIHNLKTHLSNSKLDEVIKKMLLYKYSLNIEFEIKYLQKLYVKRQDALLSADFKKGNITFEEKFEKTNKIYDEVNNSNENDFVDFEKYLKDKDLDDIYTQKNYTKTGIKPIDDKIRGLFDGQLIIVACRPGVGKTSSVWQIAQKMNEGSLFFSLEMDKTELYAKALSAKSEVEVDKIESKHMADFEIEKVLKAHSNFKENFKIKMFDNTHNYFQIVNKILSMNKKGKLRCVFIDYLQLIEGSKGDNKNERIGYITRGLKNLSRKIKKPIVLLSQLNREVDKHNRPPVLSDLRDSGEIEQNADVVIFLHEKDEETLFLIAKNRKGKVGMISDTDGNSLIKFNKSYSRFEVIEKRYEQNGKTDYFHN